MAVATGAERRQHDLLQSARARVPFRVAAPSLLALLNGLAFLLVRPDVNDLWAARARASAVQHGVGLTYWFSWFGGGTTPGNYSVLTPYTCAAVGTEMLGALSALAVTVLATLAARGTRYPIGAAWVAAIAAALNLWSGRVPFLFGAAFGVGALMVVRAKRLLPAVGLTLVSILASPVSGAFICLGLCGTFLTTRTRSYRAIIGWTVGAALAAMVVVLLLFGNPGPEPYSFWQFLVVMLGLGTLLWARPDDHLRTTIVVSWLVSLGLFFVPNGMGSNYSRFVLFCLPVAVIATSARPIKWAAFAVTPVLVTGAVGTARDLINAARPVSTVGYYSSLAKQLDGIPDLRDYRLEVVNHGAHAGYDALLDHAVLARGWETQEDYALNHSLMQDPLDPVTYKVWLDNNAVGYVALPTSAVQPYPEYTLVHQHRPSYLELIWRNTDWQLFRVGSPTPIVARPASIRALDQKSMTIRVPCRCTIAVRVRWSKYLAAALQGAGGKDALPRVYAKVVNDGSGWTTVTTAKPGTYVLRGSLQGGLFR